MRGEQIVAAACVMPLSTNTKVEERRYGLRHRAAIGITESSDAVAVIISEETGSISVAYNGRMIRKITHARLSNILAAFYQPRTARTRSWIRSILGIQIKEQSE